MIKVREGRPGIFRVELTEPELKLMQDAADRLEIPTAQVLHGLIRLVVSLYRKSLMDERSQDGLDGKDEGMGRG